LLGAAAAAAVVVSWGQRAQQTRRQEPCQERAQCFAAQAELYSDFSWLLETGTLFVGRGTGLLNFLLSGAHGEDLTMA
jgi:hypothetical protein